jgi:hypothetical protein
MATKFIFSKLFGRSVVQFPQGTVKNTVQTLVIDIDGFVIKNAKNEEAILALLNKPRVIRTQKPQNE